MLVDKILFSYFQNADGVTNNLESCKTVEKKIVEDVTDHEQDTLFYFCEKFDW